MSWLRRLDEEMERFFSATVGFDYFDRMFLFVFLSAYMMLFIYLLNSHLSASEAAELSSVFDLLSYFLLYFLIHPIVRVVFGWAGGKLVAWIEHRLEAST